MNALSCRESGFQKTGSPLFPFWDRRELRRSPGIEEPWHRIRSVALASACLTFCRLSREREKIETSGLKKKKEN